MTSLEGWGSTIELHPRGLLARRHPCSVPARAGFPHTRPRPSQGKIPSLVPNGRVFHAHRPAPRRRRHALAALWHARSRRVCPPPDDLPRNHGKCLVRLADTRPKALVRWSKVPLARAPRAPCSVLTWPVTPASRCHVRMPDITGQSHLRPVPRLALDTCRRNGHASEQAQ